MRWGGTGLSVRKLTTYVVFVEFVKYPGAVVHTDDVASGRTKKEAEQNFKRWLQKNLPRLEEWRGYMFNHSGYFIKYWLEEQTIALKETGVIP